MSKGFPASSYALGKHLPNRIRPYFAAVIRTTSPGLHTALNVFQLQYSLTISEYQKLTLLYLPNTLCLMGFRSRRTLCVNICQTACVHTLPRWRVPPHQACTEQGKSPSYSTLWPHLNRKFLLYNVLWTTCRVQSLCSWIHGFHYAPSKPHSSVHCRFHNNDLTFLAERTESFPVAVLSDQSWIKKPYFIISSEQPISCMVLVSGSIAFLMHRPNFMRPYLADSIKITWPARHWAWNVSQLQYSLIKPGLKILT